MIVIKTSKRVWGDIWSHLPEKTLMSMLRNQVLFSIEDNERINTPTEIAMIHWCDENCDGLYRIDDAFANFEKQSDLIAFKLYWAGQELIEE